ncbi:MAG: hypothetical protein K8I82_22515 [Anaerolineae bacterium]|nr:hypothetical protein [Anaerolineae bacterium]
MDKISDTLLQKIYDLAEQENRSVNELVKDLIEVYEASGAVHAEDLPPGSLARLAAAGREMPSFGKPDNTSEYADDVLKNEYTDYLLKRMNRPADE